MLETLARAEGDVDAVVAVLARDRSSAHRYLLIAHELHNGGRPDDALEWAERGLAAFTGTPTRPRSCTRHSGGGDAFDELVLDLREQHGANAISYAAGRARMVTTSS